MTEDDRPDADEECPSTFDGVHVWGKTKITGVQECGCRAIKDTRPERLEFPRLQGGVPALYVTDDDDENARAAGAHLAEFLGLGRDPKWLDSRVIPHMELWDGEMRLAGVAKAIARSMEWGQFRDYAFRADGWDKVRSRAATLGVPGYLVLTCRDRRGFVRAMARNEHRRSHEGSRGEQSRGDPRDDQMMVGVLWETFIALPPNVGP